MNEQAKRLVDYMIRLDYTIRAVEKLGYAKETVKALKKIRESLND